MQKALEGKERRGCSEKEGGNHQLWEEESMKTL